VIGVVLYLTGLAPADEPGYNFLEALWVGFLHTIPGDTLGGRETSWPFRLLMLGVMLFNVFFASMVIGALASGMQARLEELKRGRTKVFETGHTVILGWSEQIITVLAELIHAHADKPHHCIAILSPLEKTTMEDEIRQKVGDTGRVKIVCRTGSTLEMTNLDLVNINTSKNVIVITPESDNPDAEVLKVVLAILNHPNRRSAPYHIVATVREPSNAEVARVVGKDEVEWILQGDVISRMIAQTALQPGLSTVYSDLFDYSDSEIYLHKEPSLEGKTFGEALMASELVSIIGVRQPGAKPVLSPPMDTALNPDDQLVVIATDDSHIRFEQEQPPLVREEAISISPRQAPCPTHTLILGWNLRGWKILKELDRYVSPGSPTHIVADPALADVRTIEKGKNLENTRVTFQAGDTTSRTLLDSLSFDRYEHVVLLAYPEKLSIQEADARTLITLLHLRDIADRAELHFSIVTEMLDLRNRKLAVSTRPDDFIISDRMISLLVAQVAETRGMCSIYDDLFNPDGAEIYLRPASQYVRPGEKVNFYTLVEAARRNREVAIGYRQICRGGPAGSKDITIVNPAKSAEFVLGGDDQVIVISKS
jgi:voltage-gated potassium channel Kch